MNKAQWVDAYTMRLSALGTRLDPTDVSEMAAALYPLLGHQDPVATADIDADWLAWKHSDFGIED